jgi:hypothetical protein
MDEPRPSGYSATGRTARTRGGAALLAAVAAGLLLVGAAGFALAASPSSAPSSDGAGASAAPSSNVDASPAPKDKGLKGVRGLGRDLVRGLLKPGRGIGAIHITAIDGPSISLATDDGWTRTITLDSGTKITKAGETITVAALEVGDEVRFAETKAADGSFTIDRLAVVLPSVTGEVTAKSADSLTVKRFDGTSTTVHLSAVTTYTTRGKKDASLADVAVGSYVFATGDARDDGSLDAVRVLFGEPRAIEGRGHGVGGPRAPKGPRDPGSAPSPSTTPG